MESNAEFVRRCATTRLGRTARKTQRPTLDTLRLAFGIRPCGSLRGRPVLKWSEAEHLAKQPSKLKRTFRSCLDPVKRLAHCYFTNGSCGSSLRRRPSPRLNCLLFEEYLQRIELPALVPRVERSVIACSVLLVYRYQRMIVRS